MGEWSLGFSQGSGKEVKQREEEDLESGVEM